MHQMAAIMRCEIKEIKRHFPSKQECLDANTYEPIYEAQAVIVEPAQAAVPEAHLEEDEEVHNSFEERLATLESERLAAAKAASEARRNAAAAKAQQEKWEGEQRAYAAQALADLKEFEK
jgi:hypothetical protein